MDRKQFAHFQVTGGLEKGTSANLLEIRCRWNLYWMRSRVMHFLAMKITRKSNRNISCRMQASNNVTTPEIRQKATGTRHFHFKDLKKEVLFVTVKRIRGFSAKWIQERAIWREISNKGRWLSEYLNKKMTGRHLPEKHAWNKFVNKTFALLK